MGRQETAQGRPVAARRDAGGKRGGGRSQKSNPFKIVRMTSARQTEQIKAVRAVLSFESGFIRTLMVKLKKGCHFERNINCYSGSNTGSLFILHPLSKRFWSCQYKISLVLYEFSAMGKEKKLHRREILILQRKHKESYPAFAIEKISIRFFIKYDQRLGFC